MEINDCYLKIKKHNFILTFVGHYHFVARHLDDKGHNVSSRTKTTQTNACKCYCYEIKL